MWRPASAGSVDRANVFAQALKRSSGAEISVARKHVTPVARIAAAAADTWSTVVAGSLKSTPANPFTWRSTSPGARDLGHGRRAGVPVAVESGRIAIAAETACSHCLLVTMSVTVPRAR